MKIEPGTRLVHKHTSKTFVVIHGDNDGGVTLAGGGFIPPSQVKVDFNIQPSSGLSAYTTVEKILLFDMAAGLARYNVHMALVAAENGDKPAAIARLKEALAHIEEAQVFSDSVTTEHISDKLERPSTMRELAKALAFIGQ